MPYLKNNIGPAEGAWLGVSVDTNKRIIYLTSEINDVTTDTLIGSLLLMDDKTNPITLVINSEGGAVYNALAIYDAMKHLCGTVIRTVGIGKVMSAATLLLAAGDPGHRYVTPNCRLMLHMISSGSHGALEDLEKDMGETKRLSKAFQKALRKCSSDEAAEMVNLRDNYFSPQQAIKLGIVDDVATKPIVWTPYPTLNKEELKELVGTMINEEFFLDDGEGEED